MCRKDKRNAIMDAAMELLADQGFHGAPMALIAEKAGVGAGTIYRYFENRDVLIRELYQVTHDRISDCLKEGYPENRPVRERFFHICRNMLDYYIKRPVEYRYIEQFHNSPYGLEHRKAKIMNLSGEFDTVHDLFEQGKEQQVIRDMPMALYFNLTFGPIIWTLRDHHTGFLVIDDELKEIIVTGAWNSIKI